MLKVKNLSAGYNGSDVVKNITFAIGAGESLSIIGPNGCGKTTLLKAASNLIPYKGDIEIDGISVRKMKNREIALKIAMLSQMSGIYFSYSVYDTVMMGRYLHIKDRMLGLPSEYDREYVEDCLLALDLTSVRDKEITRLSGGQLQRVFLARTLAQNPQIILLDEPTNYLDLKYQIELVEYLRKWASENRRVVIGVLHDINLALRLSDNVIVMKDGAAAAFGKVGEVVTDSLLKSVYEIDVAGHMRDSLQRWLDIKA